ncbi:MAG: hypothetical protein GQE15_38945 [Archangiaceae bacterium]|nr:hypothetical protein [Archangiaceae bacterium]
MQTLSTEAELAAHLKADAGRAIVRGTLERVSKAWLGTAVVTDDGEMVWVSYGAPPGGWEPLLGRFLRVEGLLAMTRSTIEQSLVAPHLLSFGAPTEEKRELAALEGKTLRLAGLAQNAPSGRTLMVEQQVISLDAAKWPEALVGKRVSLGGTLRRHTNGWALDDATDATAC